MRQRQQVAVEAYLEFMEHHLLRLQEDAAQTGFVTDIVAAHGGLSQLA